MVDPDLAAKQRRKMVVRFGKRPADECSGHLLSICGQVAGVSTNPSAYPPAHGTWSNAKLSGRLLSSVISPIMPFMTPENGY